MSEKVTALRTQAKHHKHKDMLVNLRKFMESNHDTFNPPNKRAWKRDKIFKYSNLKEQQFPRWAIEHYLRNDIDYDDLVGKRTKLKLGKKIQKPKTVTETYYQITGDDRLKDKLYTEDEIKEFGFIPPNTNTTAEDTP